jgi:hypothetical protein
MKEKESDLIHSPCETSEGVGDGTSVGQESTTTQKGIQMSTVNILQLLNNDNVPSSLELVQLRGDETPIIPFTLEGTLVKLHYCAETEVGGYIHCNGDDCVLCRVGRKPTEKVLIPVYLPVSQSIGILPVGTSLKPGALLPQLATIQSAERRMGVFISKEGRYRFAVSTFDLTEEMDTGEEEISRFLEKFKAGEVDLTSVYPRLENEQLSAITEIARLLCLKGFEVDEGYSAS